MSQIDPNHIEGRLLSKSATTGWLDWIHGELWLFPDGLLRVSRGLTQTLLMGGYVFSPQRTTPRVFSRDEWLAFVTRPGAMWLPFAAIQHATVRHSIGADELVAVLTNGERRQLLWLPNRMVFELLRQVVATLPETRGAAAPDAAPH